VGKYKTNFLQEHFKDVCFISYFNSNLSQWHGVTSVVALRPIFLLESIEAEKQSLLWLDISKLVLCCLENIYFQLPQFDAVLFERKKNKEVRNHYWGGMVAFNQNGVAIKQFNDLIKKTHMGWFSDQEALYYLNCNILKLVYENYVSEKYDLSFPILRNKPITFFEGLDQEVQRKNEDALKKYTEILNKFIIGYEEIYNNFVGEVE
jgi:hypothetical protein